MADANAQQRPRVWDRFLTEQDKASMADREPRRKGTGDRPALLLIDLYRWVYGDQPEPILEAVKKWPGTCGLAAWEAIPHLQKLLAAARAAGIPIIHTTGDTREMVRAWAKGSGPRGEARDPEAEDRWRRRHDIIDEVAPIEGELVIRKNSPSAFWGSPLVGHLVDLGVDTVIVGGESTSGCVRASVVDGCTYRFKMNVVEECVFDRHQAPHAIDLFTMDKKYADVVPLEEALAYLDRWQESQPETAATR